MTAEEAAALTAAATAVDPEKVKTVLDCWHRAIESAARAGKRMVMETDIDRPRTPIPQTARRAALTKLESDGFIVEPIIDANLRDTVIRVRW